MVAKRRDVEEAKAAMSLAWHTATFALLGMQGKMPKLDTVMAALEPARDLRAQLTAVSQAIGIPLRPVTDAARQAWRGVES